MTDTPDVGHCLPRSGDLIILVAQVTPRHHLSERQAHAVRQLERGSYPEQDYPGLREWARAYTCIEPIRVALSAYADDIAVVHTGQATFDTFYVRCRKCGPCLRFRQHHWMRRMELEIQLAQRSWFVTFTTSPEARYCLYAPLGDEPSFAQMCNALNRELTLYLKRLRKGYGPLRCVFVHEPHKDGYPHLHGIIHEVHGQEPLLKRFVQSQWRLGFSKVVLADPGAARYLTKYLAKEARARVRASRQYGRLEAADVQIRPQPAASTDEEAGKTTTTHQTPTDKRVCLSGANSTDVQ